jgi:hypothetical protein
MEQPTDLRKVSVAKLLTFGTLKVKPRVYWLKVLAKISCKTIEFFNIF